MAASVLYTNFGGMLVQEDRGGSVRTYAHDEMGNTSYLLDDTSVTDSYEYSPYGQISHTGSAVTPFTFIGALGYFATGWSMLTSYVRARWYSSVSGQWGSVDPLWPRESAYGYVDGKPVQEADPTGYGSNLNLWKECGMGIIGNLSSILHNGPSVGIGSIICGVGQGCFTAIIGAILAKILGTLYGPIGACLGGVIGAIAGAIFSYFCSKLDPCSEPINPICFAIQTFFNALTGCLTQVLGGVGQQWLDPILSNFLGFFSSKVGQSCDFNGVHVGGSTILPGSQWK